MKRIIIFTLFFILILSTTVFATDTTTTSAVTLDVLHDDNLVIIQGLRYVFVELMFVLIFAGSILCYLFGYKIIDYFIK